jgi:hypothetical protein
MTPYTLLNLTGTLTSMTVIPIHSLALAAFLLALIATYRAYKEAL